MSRPVAAAAAAAVAVALAGIALVVAIVAVTARDPAVAAAGCAGSDVFSPLPSGEATTQPGGEAELCVLVVEHPPGGYGLAAAGTLDTAGADALVVHASEPDTVPLNAGRAHVDLTVAWVDDTNTVTGTTRVDACSPVESCMTSPPPGPWRFAVVVPRSAGVDLDTGDHFDILEPETQL